MEIKRHWQCIAANMQQCCCFVATTSCGSVVALLRLVPFFHLLVAVLWLLVAATLRLIVCSYIAACSFFVCRIFRFLALKLQPVCGLFVSCLLQTVSVNFLAHCE